MNLLRVRCAMEDLSGKLDEYLPQPAVRLVSEWINDERCRFRIARSRKTKLGDYTAPHRGGPHRISVNGDLNPYAFLVTTVHEFAHLKTWQQFKNRVRPHGEEWKHNFRLLMAPFLEMGVFPEDVSAAVMRYMSDPAASSCTDLNLHRALKAHDVDKTPVSTIESIAENAVFAFGNRVFRKGKKIRKRYRCVELPSQKVYLFHPVAEVDEI